MEVSCCTKKKPLAGVPFDTDNWTCVQADEVEAVLEATNAKHGTSVCLFAPGDTTTDHGPGSIEALYSDVMIFGFSAIDVVAEDCPAVLDPAATRAALESVRGIPAAFWADLKSGHDLLSSLDPSDNTCSSHVGAHFRSSLWPRG